MPTHDEIITIDSSDAESIITINELIERTITWSIDDNFNTDRNDTVIDMTSSHAQSIIAMNKNITRTLTAWDTNFNFEFVGIIIFVKEISIGLRRALRILDIHRNPIIFSDRPDGLPMIFSSRGNNAPIIFHSLSGLDVNITRVIELERTFNTDRNNTTPTISSTPTITKPTMGENQTRVSTISTTFDYEIAGDAFLTLNEPLTLTGIFDSSRKFLTLNETLGLTATFRRGSITLKDTLTLTGIFDSNYKFLTLNQTLTLTGSATHVIPGPPLDTLTDNFDDNSFDTVKWNSDVFGTSTLQETNQRLEFTSVNGDIYVYSVDGYSFSNTQWYCEAVEMPTDVDVEVYLYAWESGPFRAVEFYYLQYNNTINAYASGGGGTLWSATYNATDHRWFRIRETSGTFYWETSADGSSWTTRANTSSSFMVKANVFFEADVYNYDPGPDQFIMDNFNVGP